MDLVDIDGNALPDLVQTGALDGKYYFYINRGTGAWAPAPEVPSASPQHPLGENGVMMADMDGDGLADLFIKSMSSFGYFRSRGTLGWEEGDWQGLTPVPNFSLEDSDVRLLDVNNDKRIDVMVDLGSSYGIWLNRKGNVWSADFDLETRLPGGAHLRFSDPTVKLADMNGDRLEDLLYVLDGTVVYLPNKGLGEFGDPVEMGNAPVLGATIAAQLALADMNYDGLSDLVLVGDTEAMVWFNGGGDHFKEPLMFQGLPSRTAGGYRFADMNGDGFRDLLFDDESGPSRYQYVDFANGAHPNMLTRISNGLGMTTTIAYRSSTDYFIADQEAGRPWTTKIPFPVQVVSQVKVKDANSGQEYLVDYAYRDGYYDGAEKQFRGFATVTKTVRGEAGAPTLVSSYTFDVGRDEESRKGLMTSVAALEEGGTVAPPAGLFDLEEDTLVTRNLLTGTNGERVRFSFSSTKARSISEKTATPKYLLQEIDQDNYGNVTKDFNYGLVAGFTVGADRSVGNDEVLTSHEYVIDETNWVVDRPSSTRKTTLGGDFVSHQKNFYDAKGNLVRLEGSPDGTAFIPLVRNEYDARGNITKLTDANGHFRDIGYDTTFTTFPVSESVGGLGLTLSADYDFGLGVVTSSTDFNGNITRYGYDALGRLTGIFKPEDSPRAHPESPVALPTQTFSYTLGSPVSFVWTKSREVSGQAGTYDAVSYYDGLGRKLQTRSEGESGNWVVTDAVTFNQQKGVKRQWLPYFDSGSGYAAAPADNPAVAIEYDAKGRVLKQTNTADGTYSTTAYEPLRKVESDEEDTATGTHAGTPHAFGSDGLDRLVEVQQKNAGATYTTRYGYDPLGNLTKVTDNEGNVRTMVFDGLGRKTKDNDPDRHLTTYLYDDVGNLLSTSDAKGQAVAYTYDVANRILTENFDGSVKTRYHYDLNLPSKYPNLANTKGKLTWVEDEAGLEAYSYDVRGNTVKKIREAEGYAFTNRMAYDAMDRVTTLTYPDGYAVSYQYNEMNQIEAVSGFVTAIDYAPTGRKTRFAYANGIESNYQYDSRQRMSRLATAKADKLYQDFAYSYDRVSNITAVTDARPTKSTEDQSRSYRYDDLYRLAEAQAPAWTEAYQYSSIGNMTFKTDVGAMTYGGGGAGPHALTKAAGANLTYTYDANGNIASKQPGFTYTFDQNDRLAAAARASDGGQIKYTYDFGGNRVTKKVTVGAATETTVYADKYTEIRGKSIVKQVFAGNRLVARISSPFDPGCLSPRETPLTVADFDRNPTDGVISLGEIREQGNDPARLETQDVADALRIYHDTHEATPDVITFETMAKAIQELGPIETGPTSTYFYIPDHLGSANIVTDAAGAVVEESVQYPYGAERARTGSYKSEYRFTGKELDDETRLHYFGARYYDSQTGRFVSVDPMLQSLGKTTMLVLEKSISGASFSYAGQNPLLYIDENGLADVYFFDKDKIDNSYGARVWVTGDEGIVIGGMKGSTYPNTIDGDSSIAGYNSVEAKGVSEGGYRFNNKYGHHLGKPDARWGLNLINEFGERMVPGDRNMFGQKSDIGFANVHEGATDNGTYRSRGSKACLTMSPASSERFSHQFDWSTNNGVTGRSSGHVYTYRGFSVEGALVESHLREYNLGFDPIGSFYKPR